MRTLDTASGVRITVYDPGFGLRGFCAFCARSNTSACNCLHCNSRISRCAHCPKAEPFFPLMVNRRIASVPLLYAFSNSPDGHRRRIIRMVKNGVKRKQVLEIISFINENNGMVRAEEKAKQFKDLAIQELEKLPPSPARETLTSLAEFVINRSK